MRLHVLAIPIVLACACECSSRAKAQSSPTTRPATVSVPEPVQRAYADLHAATHWKDAAAARWGTNADEIATFLSGANPKNWPAADMKKHMRDHLDLTTAEVVARLNKDWKADIAAYDKVHTQILHMADMLSSGIIKQHPDKFVR